MLCYNKEETRIGLVEVPGEISLDVVITGCPYHCANCHSKHNWNGSCELSEKEYETYLKKYQNKASCICFMGGDWDENNLIPYLQKAKDYGFKTALYSGFNKPKNVLTDYLDYYKVGEYDKNLGGLESPNTNQIFYKIDNQKKYNNITYKFWRKNENSKESRRESV